MGQAVPEEHTQPHVCSAPFHVPKGQKENGPQKKVLTETGFVPSANTAELQNHHHHAGVYPQSSACSPVSYLSSVSCLSASCSASNAKISSTKGWYSRVILRKPCRKGILQRCALPTGPAGPSRMAVPPAHTQEPAGRARPAFHGAAPSSENKHGFRVALLSNKHRFPRSQNPRTPLQNLEAAPADPHRDGPGGPNPSPRSEARRTEHKTPPHRPHLTAPPPEAEVASCVLSVGGA